MSYDRKTQRKRRRRYFKAGLCWCGQPRDGEGHCCKLCKAQARRSKAKRKRKIAEPKRVFHLCGMLYCTQERVPGRRYCGYHQEIESERKQRQREARQKDGKCVDCDNLPEPGKRRCKVHLKIQAEANARYKAKVKKRQSQHPQTAA